MGQNNWEGVQFPSLGVFDSRRDAHGTDMESAQNPHLEHWVKGIVESVAHTETPAVTSRPATLQHATLYLCSARPVTSR